MGEGEVREWAQSGMGWPFKSHFFGAASNGPFNGCCVFSNICDLLNDLELRHSNRILFKYPMKISWLLHFQTLFRKILLCRLRWKCLGQTQIQFIMLLTCQNFGIWEVWLQFISLAFRACHRPTWPLLEETFCSSPLHGPRKNLHILVRPLCTHPYPLPSAPRSSESWPPRTAKVHWSQFRTSLPLPVQIYQAPGCLTSCETSIPWASVGSPFGSGLLSKFMPLLWLLPRWSFTHSLLFVFLWVSILFFKLDFKSREA